MIAPSTAGRTVRKRIKQFVDELLVFLSPVANALDSPENLERLLGELGFAPSLADLQGVAPGFQPNPTSSRT